MKINMDLLDAQSRKDTEAVLRTIRTQGLTRALKTLTKTQITTQKKEA